MSAKTYIVCDFCSGILNETKTEKPEKQGNLVYITEAVKAKWNLNSQRIVTVEVRINGGAVDLCEQCRNEAILMATPFNETSRIGK